MIVLALTSLAATERLAQALAPLLCEGDVVELVGDIGAGKTTFTGSLARALGSTEPVRSPTYTIAHRYELPDEAPARFLAHLDCYRQPGEVDDAAWGDLEPYFEGGVACVEWPEPIRPWLRDRATWRVELETIADVSRIARISAPTRESMGEFTSGFTSGSTGRSTSGSTGGSTVSSTGGPIGESTGESTSESSQRGARGGATSWSTCLIRALICDDGAPPRR
ncbi:MAG: hypothetical protein JWN41_711 [Thermoleophilia bacterium]|nr:hypothetical protein [Thermoleophilia bacterium]